MKKFLAAVMILALVLSLAGCGGKDTGEQTGNGNSQTETNGGKNDTLNSQAETDTNSVQKDDGNSQTDAGTNSGQNDSENTAAQGTDQNSVSLSDLFGNRENTSDDTSTTDDSGNTGTSTDAGTGSSSGDMSYDEMMQILNDYFGEDENAGVDYFKFPAVKSYEKWPDADMWKAMGMIDIQPKGCDFAEIYNDGKYYGYGSNCFTAKCQADEGAIDTINQQLFDAGYRKKFVEDGIFVDAKSIEELYDNTFGYYTAFYEYDGWLLYVQTWVSDWDQSIYVSVYDASTTDMNYKEYPAVSWPTAEMQKLPVDIGGIGSTFTGYWNDEENYPAIYAKNVTREQFDAYLEKLNSMEGVYTDGSDGGWGDGWESYYAYIDGCDTGIIEFYYHEEAQLVEWTWYYYDE